MNKSEQDYLYLKYPKLFAQKDMPSSESRMSDGICTSIGWLNLLDSMCQELQAYSDKTDDQVEFVQVKQKFGFLRAYISSAENKHDAQEIIEKYESMSAGICEQCGGTDEVKQNNTRCDNTWKMKLCSKCREEEDNDDNGSRP